MLRVLATSGLIGLAVPAAGAEPPLAPDASGAEIIVEGRRTTDRYRLPEVLRPLASSDRYQPPAAADPRIACHNVGAFGCGTEVLPILTVRGDGSIQIGSDPGR